MSQSSQTSTPNPQLGAALALVQLLTEFPQLAQASWRVDRDGLLSGTVAYNSDHDMRPAMQVYADVLGADVHEQKFSPNEMKKQPHVSFTIYATWRDVKVNVWASCPVSALAETVQVAA